MTKYIITLFIFFLTSCATSLKYNLDSLHSFDNKRQSDFLEENNLKFPFVASFKNGNGELRYLPVSHAGDKNSPTFTLIKKSIQSFKPDVILLEGIEMTEGYSSKRVINKAKNCSPHWNKCVEILYAANLSNKNNINFIGCEPSDLEMFKELKKNGYTKERY